MSAAVTLLATAAVTVSTVSVLRAARRRLAEGERRLAAHRARQAAMRDGPVLELEPGEDGVYGVARPPAEPAP